MEQAKNKKTIFITGATGKKGVAEFFGTIAGSIDYKDFQPREFFAEDDRVFVKGYHEATVKSTGKTFGHGFLMEFSTQKREDQPFLCLCGYAGPGHRIY